MAESGYVEVPGGQLYFEVEGTGRPVMLIPGGLGDLRMWDKQVGAFAERYRVIRYDPRGYGRTETDDIAFSNRDDAAAVLGHVGAASCHLVGQSRGGTIALDLTLERPELVDSLVLVASGAGGFQPQLPDGVEPPPWDEMERMWEAREWDQLSELEAQVWVDGWGQPATRVDPNLRRKVHDRILSTYQAAKPEGQPQPLEPAAATRLDEVRVPTLVIIGTVDEPGGILNSRHVADKIAGARLATFEGVAHMVQLEQPERFNTLVLEFLAGVEATDSSA